MRSHAVIFDFGNVFAHFSYAKACEEIARARDCSPEQVLDELRAAGLNDWVVEYETGRMSSDRFSDHVCQAAKTSMSRAKFAESWRDIFTLNEPIVKLAFQLRDSGYPLVLGSNTNELHAEHFQSKFAEQLSVFRGKILSYQLGAMKPDPVFYLACADAGGRPAEYCIFIDDLEANVQGANNAGLQGIHYRNDMQLSADLKHLGIEV